MSAIFLSKTISELPVPLNNVKSIDLNEVFSNYLTKEEVAAITSRTDNLISSARFPEPSEAWPAVPWPPV